MHKLILIFYLHLLCFSPAHGQDVDIIDNVKQQLPNSWTCDLESYDGNAYIVVTTTEMKTVGSMYGNAGPGTTSQQLRIRFKLLPRYSPATLKRITEFNEPLKKQLESLDYYSAEYRDVSRKLIDMPTFQNATCGIRAEYLSRVPENKDSKATLSKFLTEISRDWQMVNDGDTKPAKKLIAQLTR